MERKFKNGEMVLWAGKLVKVMYARLDYPITSLEWRGGGYQPKKGMQPEWFYSLLGHGREVREKNLCGTTSKS